MRKVLNLEVIGQLALAKVYAFDNPEHRFYRQREKGSWCRVEVRNAQALKEPPCLMGLMAAHVVEQNNMSLAPSRSSAVQV